MDSRKLIHARELDRLSHDHRYHLDAQGRGERMTHRVIVLTAVTMVVEIVVGLTSHSMALLADGWHMGTHAAALGITAFAYAYARRHRDDPRYTFGTGKVGVLGGFSSAVVLALVALLVAAESAQRLYAPLEIHFDEAILVAVVGLVINIASAFLLKDHHYGPEDLGGHEHRHDDHARGHHHHDHNLRGAYLHVIADATTSVLAIVALLAGKTVGWVWLDPAMGIVGAALISRWSYGLLRDTGRILLDGAVAREQVASIRQAIEADADNRVADLHVWRVGPYHLAAIVSVVTHTPRSPHHYKRLLRDHEGLTHVTVEVNQCADERCETESSG